MQGQEPGWPHCELERGTDNFGFFPLSFSGLAVTQMSCPCHSLPVDWAIAPRVVLAQRGRWSSRREQPGRARAFPWAHSWLLLAQGDLKFSLSSASNVQLSAGSFWASYWDCCPWWLWPLCPLRQMLTPQQRGRVVKSLLLLSPPQVIIICMSHTAWQGWMTL